MLIVDAIVLVVRVPRSRRWRAPALVLAGGASATGWSLLVAFLQNVDTDGSVEVDPLAGGIVAAVATVILATAIVRMWPRGVSSCP